MNPFVPLIAEAAGTTLSVKQLVFRISLNVINPLIVLGFAVALLYFSYGVVEYIRDRNNGTLFSKDPKGGADRIVWGLFGLFIMVSAFGIMHLLKTIIGSDIQTP